MIIKDPKTIVNFLKGETQDYKGRTYADIIGCDDTKMEQCHDQVQWMFPLHEESNFASTYPVITEEVVKEAKENKDVIKNLKLASERMEKFYGIGRFTDIDKQRKWCREGDHNLLRITRIIRCLRIFGLEQEAEYFYNIVRDASLRFLDYEYVAFKYWDKALVEDIWDSLR